MNDCLLIILFFVIVKYKDLNLSMQNVSVKKVPKNLFISHMDQITIWVYLALKNNITMYLSRPWNVLNNKSLTGFVDSKRQSFCQYTEMNHHSQN